MPPTISCRQLPLPVAHPPLAPLPGQPPATAPPLGWASLSPAEQTRIRQALVLVLQEVSRVPNAP